MKMYYLNMLLFTFLINTLVLLHNENYLNNHYNVMNFLKNSCEEDQAVAGPLFCKASNALTDSGRSYEFSKSIYEMAADAADAARKAANGKYAEMTSVVEKNGTKYTGGNDAEPRSTLEKELLETYEEMFGEESDIMLKSGRCPNDDEKSATCECTDINGGKLSKTKGRDKYLKKLKHRCIGGICSCSVGSFLLTMFGLHAAKAAALAEFTKYGTTYSACKSSITIYSMLSSDSMIAGSTACFTDLTVPAATSAGAIFDPCGITALVLLILAVILIILYIWLYRRRKNSWKHECKKHLCK
ncbi:hypothetical protein PFFCH_00560 [Plasmodium falciparum FCH/4]|uniref:Surface antigen n=1 Tax=Plasmodium falciparum FCH/4 TaxID=1036724 RepID=A0A024VUY1_PLAFA|nr:hypothetical protein PFFCH_00560 [Plasmodium falciparum FCH/4]